MTGSSEAASQLRIKFVPIKPAPPVTRIMGLPHIERGSVMTCGWGVKQIGFEEGPYLKRTTRSSWRLESWAISRVSSSEASISVWERSEMAAMADVLRSISMAMDDCSSAAAAIWCDIWSMLLTESEIEARAL